LGESCSFVQQLAVGGLTAQHDVAAQPSPCRIPQLIMAPPQPNLGKVNGFVLIKFLGKGTFGSVYQVRREEDGKVYAMKKVDTRRMTAKERAEAVNEIRVLASVAGDQVITFYEAFVEADVLYIVTEFATHGDLFAYLKTARRRGNLPEETVWSMFIQMCLGVRTLHDKNIMHRDLKAANVFMCSSSYLKLGDFGVSKVLKHSEALARTQVGTPYYVAPEVWRNRPYNNKCDMWSLGCLLYELCTYRPPFEAESMEGLARKIMKGKYDPVPPGYSKDLHNMIARLLVVDPARRASVDEVLCTAAVVARMNDLPPRPDGSEAPPAEAVDLVRTIQVPRKFNDLTKNLPKSRYDTPLATPQIVEAAIIGRPADVAALKPVIEAAAEESAWQPEPVKQLIRKPPAPSQLPPGRPGVKPSGGNTPLVSAQRQRVGGAGLVQPHQPSQQPMIKLPQVRDAQPKPKLPPTPSNPEIRVVYHNPHHAAAQNSRVSIFRANQNGVNGSSYNPITHQNSHYPGAHYHNRHQPHAYQPRGYESRLARLHTGSSQHSHHHPVGARQRVAAARYY